MKSRGWNMILLFFSLLLPSCVERIDIPLDSSTVKLVVDGAVTTDTTAQRVILTETTDYYFDQPSPKVTGAIVRISDGTEEYVLREGDPGVYLTEPTFYGVPGKTYTLNIKLAQPVGGYSEYSAASTLYPVSHLDSVSLEFHPEWTENGIWVVKCYIQDPPTTDYYRFLISKNSEMITDTLDEWFVTDDRFFNGNYAYGAPVAYLRQGREDEVLIPGDTVGVEVNSISPEYAYFIWDAQSEIRGSNPLFSGPPANVKGNISNGAMGFFAAYSISRSYTVLSDYP